MHWETSGIGGMQNEEEVIGCSRSAEAQVLFWKLLISVLYTLPAKESRGFKSHTNEHQIRASGLVLSLLLHQNILDVCQQEQFLCVCVLVQGIVPFLNDSPTDFFFKVFCSVLLSSPEDIFSVEFQRVEGSEGEGRERQKY